MQYRVSYDPLTSVLLFNCGRNSRDRGWVGLIDLRLSEDNCIDPENITLTCTFTGEEQVLAIGTDHRAKIALVRVDFTTQVFQWRPGIIRTAETDIQVGPAKTVLATVDGNNKVTLIPSNVDIALVIFGVDDLAQVLRRLVDPVHQSGTIDVSFPIPLFSYRLKIKRTGLDQRSSANLLTMIFVPVPGVQAVK